MLSTVAVPHLVEGDRRSTDPVSVKVARLLLDAINRGEFPIGSRLPSERLLSQRFGVSRPSLREALSALQFAGVAESRQGFGTVVVSRDALVVSDQDGDVAASRIELLEARVILEPEAVRIAALDPDLDALERARSLLNGMWLAVESAPMVGADTDLNLHVALVTICRNPIIRGAAVEALRAARLSHWKTVRSAAWTNPRTIEAWTIQHESTLTAVQSGDGPRAARACRHHLLAVIELVLESARLSKPDRLRLAGILRLHGANVRP